MAIILQPAFEDLPAYRPVKFETKIFQINPTVAENAVVTIFESGVPIGPAIRYKSSRNEPSILGPSITDYFFEIDIQKYIQDYLGPDTSLTSVFVDPASFTAITNEDLFGVFSISITYESISPITGLLEPVVGVTDISNAFNVYSIARQCTSPFFEQMDLTDYIGTPTKADTRFLTKSARSLNVCNEDNSFLSVIQANTFQPLAGYEVKLYDSNDILLSEGLSFTLAPLFGAEFTLNTGFTALQSNVYLTGPPNFSDPNVKYYTVSFGYLVALPGPVFIYTIKTESFRYNLTSKCCGLRDLRLHWFNLLGGVDSYTFQSEKALELAATSDRAEKALGWEIGSTTPHSVSDVGKFKIKSEATPAFLLKSKILTNEQATWLSELLTSPKVYAEIEGEFVPVIIENKTQQISRQSGKIQIEIQATLANDWIIQRI